MGTKNNPGKFDCYENAKPDEPMFVLLARDDLAPHLTRLWAACKRADSIVMKSVMGELASAVGQREIDGKTIKSAKANEAVFCATSMEMWKKKNPDT